MEAAALSVVPSSVDTSLKIFDRLHQSYRKHKQLPQSIDSLRKDLRAIEEAIGTRSGTAWIADRKEICHRIQDSVELYNFKIDSDNSGTGLRGLLPLAHDALAGASKKLVKDIDEIKQLVANANHRVENYQPLNSHHGETSAAREQAYQHPKEACPVGLERATTDLVHMLSGANAKLMIQAIVGPSGSGKSVLAEAVYNQVQQQEQFECVAWVTAQHEVNILLGNMLDELKFARPPPSIDLRKHLRGLLQGKRYIIVIDGLETTGYWNDVLNACPDDNMRSRIIVTAIKEGIGRSCQKNCPVPVYKMVSLDKITAQSLLIRKAFGEIDRCPNNLDVTMILETCEYLPLAIANMGDHIRSKKEWDNAMCVDACNNIGSLLDKRKKEEFIGMDYVLNRSYTSLSDNAKTLLLSLTCGIDQVIKRKSLIRRWIAQSRLPNQSEELANECFNDLREQNFILPEKFSINGQVKTFRVNRMMRQFIKDKAISENFVTCLDVRHGQKVEPRVYINGLFLHNHSDKKYPAIGKKCDLSRVRWLIFQGKANKDLMVSIGSTILLLRVLALENIENMTDGHLEAICWPSMLKYLSIRGSRNVSKLPKNIRNLQHLVTLDTRETKVDKIDMAVVLLLPELVHLFGEFQILYKISSMEESLPRIRNSKLQTLSRFFVDETTTDFLILLPHMPNLRKVIIVSQHSTLSEEVNEVLLHSLKSCLEGALSRNSNTEGVQSQPNLHLRSLAIDFKGDIAFMDRLDAPNPCFLQSLKLCGSLSRLPDFILSDCLKELCLSRTGVDDNVLEALQTLQNLEFLELTEDPFFETGKAYTWRKGWFMKLKRLCFMVRKLPRIDIEEKAMESLESLQLLCTELVGFTGIRHLLRLEEVILPSNVIGEAAENLSQQISEHTLRPKFTRSSSVNDDESVRSARTLERSNRLARREA